MGERSTQRGTKRIASVVAALVASAGVLGAVGLAALDGDSPAGATPAAVGTGPAPGRPAPPELDALLATAEYVSEDGSYVRLGEVEMSSATVSRATPAAPVTPGG
jgi:hypothetical protein